MIEHMYDISMIDAVTVERDHDADVVGLAGHLNVLNARFVALAESVLATGASAACGRPSST
jgi:hypothetical protein